MTRRGLALHLLLDYRIYEAVVWKQKAVNQINEHFSMGTKEAGDVLFSFGSLSECGRCEKLTMHISAFPWKCKY